MLTVLALGAIALGPVAPAAGALPDIDSPELSLNHIVRTNPFVGSSVSAKDNEGSAYVPQDNSFWIGDDDGRAIYEVNASTGQLKRTFPRAALEATPRFGGGAVAGSNRDRDIESLAYDSITDTLYVFSGSCCSSSVLPTVFRFTRQGGSLQLDSYQPLPSGSDFTAAGWNPNDGKIYVGVSKTLRSYVYTSNTLGPTFQISGLSGILGLTFTADGADLLVVRSGTTLTRIDWASRSIVSGWTFDLSEFGMLDTRAVELIGNQFWVSDGYDDRSSGDPKSHAVFVFDIVGAPSQPTAPTAAFTASTTSGTAPLNVSFTDTSTGGPTSWQWNFGDGQSSTARNPSHVFADPGVYTVTLTASNANGSSSANRQITVSDVPPPPPPPGDNLIGNPGFEQNTAGWDTGGYATVTLTRVAGGHSGTSAAKIANTGTSTVTSTLNDAPDSVQTSRAGTYTGSLWVRADSAGAKLYLRVREFRGSTKLSEKLVGVVLSTQWQKVSASLAPVSPGTSTIDFSAAVYSSARGSSYYADDAVLTFG